jgi:polyisoprenyl-teichoic acid--peptidoglycan teichoic acid transferase
MTPAGVSRETVRQANRPKARGGRIINPAARRRRRRRIAAVVLAVVAVLLVAGGIAAFAFVRSINARINPVMNDSALAQKMADETPPPGDPFYILLMGDDRRPGETQARSDTLIVARVDPKLKHVQMISILRDTRVDIPGRGFDKINAAASLGGPELALKTVRQLTGLPITRYLTVDFSGFRYIVDAMGGVWLDVPQKIDDTPAGHVDTAWDKANRIIPAGLQLLNGEQALTFVRARHQFADQDYSRVKNQQLFIKALAKQALQLTNVFKAPAIINAVVDHIRTNMSLQQLADLALQLKGMKDGDLEGASAPSAPKYMNGISWVILDDAKFKAMIDRMRRGEPLVPAGTAPSSAPTATVDPSSVTISIRNGAGVSGLAKQASDYLTKLGFKVVETGNTNQFVYGKTLIVFKTATEAKAGPVLAALGYGSVLPAAGMYSFKGDILLVIGKDWQNPATSGTTP